MSGPIEIVCDLASGQPRHEGSKRLRCRGCTRAVWVSPDGFEIVSKHGAKVLCVPCFNRAPGPVKLVARGRAQELLDEIYRGSRN